MKRSEAALGDTAIITLIAACIPEISPALPNAHRSSFKEKEPASRLICFASALLTEKWFFIHKKI